MSSPHQAPSTSLSTPWETAGGTKRTVQGRAKLNEDSGEILEAPPKRTPFHGAIALREIITVPGGRIGVCVCVCVCACMCVSFLLFTSFLTLHAVMFVFAEITRLLNHVCVYVCACKVCSTVV